MIDDEGRRPIDGEITFVNTLRKGVQIDSGFHQEQREKIADDPERYECINKHSLCQFMLGNLCS